MTPPAVAALRFGWACLLGAGLGLVYGFLRPLRRRFPNLSDLLFLICALWGTLLLMFGICRGDFRFPYCGGLFLGGFLWEITIGRLLRGVFGGFWNFLDRLDRKSVV